MFLKHKEDSEFENTYKDFVFLKKQKLGQQLTEINNADITYRVQKIVEEKHLNKQETNQFKIFIQDFCHVRDQLMHIKDV